MKFQCIQQQHLQQTAASPGFWEATKISELA